MQADATHGFVATLSDGTVAAEHTDNWQIIAGARKPFVRLCAFVAQNNLHVTSFRYNANGTTYHAPKLDTRFAKGGLQPQYYSIEYIYERDEGFDGVEELHFVDMAAHYGDISVHTIIQIGGQKTVWTQVRKNYKVLERVKAFSDVKE